MTNSRKTAGRNSAKTRKNYVVTSPNGRSVIIENLNLTANQVKSKALPYLRATDDSSLQRDDLRMKQVVVA